MNKIFFSILLLLSVSVTFAGDVPIPPTEKLRSFIKSFADYAALSPEERAKAHKPACDFPPLSKAAAEVWQKELWVAWIEHVKSSRSKEEVDLGDPWITGKGVIQANAYVPNGQKKTVSMRYGTRHFGAKPKTGWPLYINLHGGGDNKHLNDQAWALTKSQYPIKTGLYLCPRSLLDTAESWYDPVYYPLIQKMMMEAYALWDVDPNRVYLMGYSMGGWGTLHLCPSIPDYWAAGACSAGAGFTGPTGRSSPDNLRNLPMLIQVGAKDNAFNRRALSKIFAEAIKALQEKDKDGYIFEYKEHPNAEHSINDKDTPGWLAKFTRNSLPKKIVWQQLFPPLGNTKPEVDKLLAANPRISEFYRKQFYWLRNESPGSHQRLVASREENTITIEQAKHLDKASVLLNDRMADLDKPVRITSNGKELFAQVAPREVAVMIASLVERGDPEMIFSAEIPVSVPDSVEELEKKNLTDTNELLERVENRMTLGKYAEANQDAEAALTLGPKSGSKFYPYLYKIAELQKDPAAKIGVLRRWVPEASDNLMLVSEYSWECLTNVREDLRDLETGLEYAQKALTISGSNNPKTLNLLALAYFKNGKTQEAVDTQRKAVAALPANLPPVRAEPFKRQLKEFEDALKK